MKLKLRLFKGGPGATICPAQWKHFNWKVSEQILLVETRTTSLEANERTTLVVSWASNIWFDLAWWYKDIPFDTLFEWLSGGNENWQPDLTRGTQSQSNSKHRSFRLMSFTPEHSSIAAEYRAHNIIYPSINVKSSQVSKGPSSTSSRISYTNISL